MIACVTSAPTAVWITIACAWSRSSTTTPVTPSSAADGRERVVADPVDLDLDDRASPTPAFRSRGVPWATISPRATTAMRSQSSSASNM